MVFASRALQSLATPSHSMHINARAARIQMRPGTARRFAAGSLGARAAADSAAGEGGAVVSRLRAGIRAMTMPTAPAAPRVAAGLIPALGARAPASAAMTPPPAKVAWDPGPTGPRVAASPA